MLTLANFYPINNMWPRAIKKSPRNCKILLTMQLLLKNIDVTKTANFNKKNTYVNENYGARSRNIYMFWSLLSSGVTMLSFIIAGHT